MGSNHDIAHLGFFFFSKELWNDELSIMKRGLKSVMKGDVK